MTRAEVAEWEWATDALNTRGIDEDAFRLTVNGWKVVHQGDVVGVLFQGAGTRVHVEWYDPANADFFSAAWTRNLRHGAAQVVHARQQAGHGVPVDVAPEPVKAPQPVRPVWLEEGTQVRYHGSIEQLHGQEFRVHECARFDDCQHWDCNGYALVPIGDWRPIALHVGIGSVTALHPAAA
ncbi:hypothetical protein [Streptomyces sp. NPDC088254]|uniref:hypothetical protein n=1 Tax=Streptomyces sp. NPDC088254 TaxID=3365847 RepID=UPI00382DD5BE